jgi:hypothetical protein
MKITCRIGLHRDFIREDREFHSVVTDEGEVVDAEERKECRCGAVIKNESHTKTLRTVERTAETRALERVPRSA